MSKQFAGSVQPIDLRRLLDSHWPAVTPSSSLIGRDIFTVLGDSYHHPGETHEILAPYASEGGKRSVLRGGLFFFDIF